MATAGLKYFLFMFNFFKQKLEHLLDSGQSDLAGVWIILSNIFCHIFPTNPLNEMTEKVLIFSYFMH